MGERLFGAGYGSPATWHTAWSLAVALLGTHLLVAGFALYARSTTVADNGPRIDPELADRIFEPFGSTKSRGQGIGLGLAICRRLASSMGAQLSMVNRPDPETGAVFTLRIPMAPPPPGDGEDDAQPEIPRSAGAEIPEPLARPQAVERREGAA